MSKVLVDLDDLADDTAFYVQQVCTSLITCKDCKHWDKDITPRVPDTKEYHFCPMMDCNTSEDFYCADGERRE